MAEKWNLNFSSQDELREFVYGNVKNPLFQKDNSVIVQDGKVLYKQKKSVLQNYALGIIRFFNPYSYDGESIRNVKDYWINNPLGTLIGGSGLLSFIYIILLLKWYIIIDQHKWFVY